jgi:hypothetical protein
VGNPIQETLPDMKVARSLPAIAGPLVLAALLTIPAFAADTTISGKVSDSMCGAKHQMAGDDASCTRACVKQGSKYALVVGDKVYTLETGDQAALDKLNGLAGASAKVTGEVKGDTITVKSVAAGS